MPKPDTAKLKAIAAAVARETSDPDLRDSVIRCLLAWMEKWPNDPWRTVSVEKPFAHLSKDLKGRPFYFVGKRDYDGEDKRGIFLGEYKTHRGPWMKRMTVDTMLADWFEGWKLNLQAAMYLHAQRLEFGKRLKYLRYLVRVAVKAGPYNAAQVREQWFSFKVDIWKSLVRSFYGTVTQILDSQELNNWPKTDSACVNKYRKLCPYWGSCQGKAPLVQLFPYKPHLTHLNALDPSIPWFDVSGVRVYQECPQKWHETYILRKVPARSAPLEEGSAFHGGIEVLYG